MNIYSKNRTSSYYYRKIYEQHHGKIPVDDSGRTYEIHHLDGDTENNHPDNLVALTIQEHYDIHKNQGDTKACLAIAARMEVSADEKRALAIAANTGDKNPSYGSKWWNNGITEVRTKVKPDGDEWVRGRFNIKYKINTTKSSNNSHPVGNKNARYDHTIYSFHNIHTGETINSTRFDFRTSNNINKTIVRELINGVRKCYNGWVRTDR
jgi:hypothetical protein